MSRQNKDPFYKPDRPVSLRQALYWLWFEPLLLQRFNDSMTPAERRRYFLRVYPRYALGVILLTMAAWLLVTALMASGDWPIQLHEWAVQNLPVRSKGWIWNPEIITTLQTPQPFYLKWTEILRLSLSGLAVGLAFGLAGGLAFSLAGGLAVGLAFGLAGGLVGGLVGGSAFGSAFGLAGGLAGGLTFGLAFGLAFGLTRGLTRGLTFGLTVGLAEGLVGGLAEGSAEGLAEGLIFGLTFGLTFGLGIIFGYYFLIFHPVSTLRYFIGYFFHSATLTHNPYLHHGALIIPLPHIESALAQTASRDPETAKKFMDFLLRYRPRQRKLAVRIWHHRWSTLLAQSPLSPEVLHENTAVLKAGKKTAYPAEFIEQAELCAQSILSAEQSNHSAVQLDHYRDLQKHLQIWREQALALPPKWNGLYIPAIDRWISAAKALIADKERGLKLQERSSPNRFIPKTALQPNSFALELFRGRQDAIRLLEAHVLNSVEMPMLLIQGQRRIGKTSLLNHLPRLLGSRFRIVHQDLQSAECQGVNEWMVDLYRKFNHILDIRVEESWTPVPGSAWVLNWKALSKHLAAVANQKEYRIILAIDEYESLHQYLCLQPEEGARLLAAMRSFSQHQRNIVFLFAGLRFFAELENPDWSEYFVQRERIHVGFLSESDARSLVTDPYEGFALRYPPAVVEEILRLAAGHPALLQQIGFEMVNRANTMDRGTDMTMEDLHFIVDQKVLDIENGTIQVFWKEFCADPAYKKTVNTIIETGRPGEPTITRRLLEYSYICQRPDGKYTMSVPLFEMWVKKNRDWFGSDSIER